MKLSLYFITGVIGLAAALPAAAQFQRPEQAVKYRQSALSVMGTHTGRLGAMASGRTPFDAAQAQANADVIVAMSRLPWQGFVEGTAANTRAKPEIWTERAKFDAAAAKMQEEALKVQAAARTGDIAQIRAAMGNLGASCKACHDAYQVPQ
jgi:cytochrome c556